MKQMKTIVSLFALLLPLCAAQAQFLQPTNPPATVRFAWDPSTSPDVTSYKLYYGVASGQYTNAISVTGTNTQITLVRGATYYFAVTSVSTNGLESPFSNEISYTPAVVPAPPHLRLAFNDNTVQGVTDPYMLVTVESTTDLKAPWTPVGTASADGAGSFALTNLNTTPKATFYRARWS